MKLKKVKLTKSDKKWLKDAAVKSRGHVPFCNYGEEEFRQVIERHIEVLSLINKLPERKRKKKKR